jgi:hypothetical protein
VRVLQYHSQSRKSEPGDLTQDIRFDKIMLQGNCMFIRLLSALVLTVIPVQTVMADAEQAASDSIVCFNANNSKGIDACSRLIADAKDPNERAT